MVIVLFVVSIGFSAVRLIQLKSEKDKLEKLNEELTQMKEDLSVEAQLVNSAEYMEQQARETLRMIKRRRTSLYHFRREPFTGRTNTVKWTSSA